MSRYCDRYNPNEIARSKTANNAKRIPVITSLEEQNKFLQSNIGVIQGCDPETKRRIESMISKLIYYQPIDYAEQGPTSQAFHRLSCPIRVNNSITSRPDIWPEAPTNLAIVKNEDQEELEVFCAAIIRMCLHLRMHVDDISKVTIRSDDFEPNAGLGVHGDSPTKDDHDDLSCRLIFRAGGPQLIQFAGYTCTEEESRASKKVHGLSVDIGASSGEDIMAYLTTPFSNGKLFMCWEDAEKKVGIQAKHRVKRIAPNGVPAVTFVVDFPLRSLRAVKEALATFNTLGQFKLDFSDLDIEK